VIEPLVPAREAAAALGMSTAWVLDRFEAGELPGYKIGRAVRFKESELVEWLEQRRRGPSPRGGREEEVSPAPLDGPPRA
jgi:excisionase family DNA binding protein